MKRLYTYIILTLGTVISAAAQSAAPTAHPLDAVAAADTNSDTGSNGAPAADAGADAPATPRFAVKTNLLYDALLNVNIGAEMRVAPRWSLDLSADYNNWRLSHGRQWKHWFVQPEVRYWTGGTPFSRHFVAADIITGQFNTTLNGARRQGWGVGAGVGYGYVWRPSPHWGIEAELAVGYIHFSYDKYPCAGCGRKIASRHRNYVGPVKAAVNVIYYLGRANKPSPAVTVPLPPVPEPLPAPAQTDTVEPLRFELVDIPHSRVRSEELAGVARIQFAVSDTVLDRTIGANAAELGSIAARLDSIRNGLDMQIVSIQLTGYASPEGPYRNNERLAAARTAALHGHIRDTYAVADSLITDTYVAEDWTGLRNAVADSDLPDRDEILDIIDTTTEPDAREAAIRRHRTSWRQIAATVLPSLRRTEYIIRYEHRYEEQETHTLEAVNKAIADGDTDLAARLLVDIPSSTEADYARGIVAALRHRYDEALAWLARTRSRGITQADNAIRTINGYRKL